MAANNTVLQRGGHCWNENVTMGGFFLVMCWALMAVKCTNKLCILIRNGKPLLQSTTVLCNIRPHVLTFTFT